jgi:hypothetical protein
MSECGSLDELNEKHARNYRIEGQGLGNVFVHSACPFCAEPDFLVYELLEVEKAMENGAVCKHCDRGMKVVVTKDGRDCTRVEFVQTCGPDAPDWFPKLRRLS